MPIVNDKMLSDNEAHARLVAAVYALGNEQGESTRANAALVAARRSLMLLQISLVAAMEADEDRLRCVIPRSA